jgi:hypothetical protein
MDERQQQILDRRRAAREAGMRQESTRRNERPEQQPIRHWWLHPRDCADNQS